MGLFKANKNEAIEALSKLQEMDYAAKSAELADIYKRLQDGRKAFAAVYDLNVNAVSGVSAIDQEIKFYSEKLEQITMSIAESTRGIHDATSESAGVAQIVSERHEELTNTIINVSEKSNDVYKKIEEGQDALTEIRELSDNTIKASETMQKDMRELTDVIEKMNEVIEDINAISSQTNLLSLNASIEAARAGEAGRGFAVVADEIRSLADETKNLTDNMGGFVEGVRSASQKSAESVENAIAALESVNEKIKHVWEINEENQQHVANITDNISNLAAVSEEISSSMNEIEAKASEIENSCGLLENNTIGLEEISNSCNEAIKPLGTIENAVDDVLKKMSALSHDPFYTLKHDELDSFLDSAVKGHREWMEKLDEIVREKKILPLQLSEEKCRFGYFYHSIELPVPALKTLWMEIGSEHSKVHKLASEIIQALFSEEYHEAGRMYQEVKNSSEKLIAKSLELKKQLPANI